MITRLVFLALLTLLAIQPSVTNAQGTIMGYCTSNVGQPVVYFSAIFDSKIPSQVRRLNTNPWASDFNAYLMGRFDFKSSQNFGGGCAGGRMADMEESKRKLETQDPEPAPRPAAPRPTNQSRDAAVKELPESKAFCSKDPMLSIVFNCDNFARSVYNYRTEHPTDTSTLASLIAADKVYLADAIDNTHVDNWVNNRGQAQKLDQKVINCVSQKVIVTLQSKPQANRLQDFYRDAVAACKSP